MRKLLSMLTLSFAACAVWAQPFYYQSVMPDGRVIIGDKPAPGAKSVRQIPLRAGNIATPIQSPARPAAAPGAASPQGADSPEPDVNTAQQELDAARVALQDGREPQPDDRIGTAGGASRLTEAYFQRVKTLEEAVANAQKRLDDARAQRKSAR